MKYILAALIGLSFYSANAQINKDRIYGTWVLSQVSYKDGTSLPDEHPLKFIYIKYTFGNPDKLWSSLAFFENGTERSFEIKNGNLLLKSPEGYVINTQKIEGLGDKLILLQAGRDGINDPASLLFTYLPEDVYQESIPLKLSDIQSVYHGDTTYVESPKIYASYKGDSFQGYMYKGISSRISMDKKPGHLFAIFKSLKQVLPIAYE